jgi:hypothetical protein
VTTGLPASKAFSIAVTGCPNNEGYSIDGITLPIVVHLSDRYSNPAPDGTAVAFTTNGGQVGGNCTTANGTCSVNWVSANPRPTPADHPPTLRAGRTTILATAIGEESFTDTNGNGYYDSGEPFDDVGEPYRDDNENGTYELGEYFLDFNQNHMRDAPTGSFVGITCSGSSCTSTTAAIGASLKLVMSASTPDGIQPVNGTTLPALTHGTTNNYSFLIQDANLNPMPAGTKVTVAVNGSGVTANAPTTYTVPCTTDPTTYVFSLTAQATFTAGNSVQLTITVQSPSGLSSVMFYTVPGA